MEKLSPTRGLPSEQLTAFSPMGYEAFAHRTNPEPFTGTATIRPTGDPFAGWLNDGTSRILPHASTASSGNRTTEPQYSSVSPQLARTANAVRTSIGPFQYSSVSPHLSPTTSGPGGMRYSPSHVQASRSLEQMAYSPRSSTHRQTHLGASQYPLSPVQTGIANARYSPSREDISYEYSPTPDFLSSLFATTRVPSAATSTNALTHVSPDNQAGRATGTTNLPSLSGGSQDVTEKHRSFIVHQVPTDTPHRSIVMMFPINEYPSIEDVCLKHIEARGVFSISFGDIREAVHAMKQIRLTRPSWRVFAAGCEEIANFNRIAGSAPSASVPRDGVFLLSVCTIPSQWLMEPMEDIVKHVLASLGSLSSCNLIENGTNMSRYQVEYFNKRHAAYAFSCLDGFKLDSLRFNVSICAEEDIPTPSHLRTTSFGSPQSPVTPYHLVSKESEVEEKIDISPASETGQTSAEHAIDLDRIRQGLDVRSTVMIRNIPNKITSDQLKSILDESSYGKYDFLYLRMDFTHRCNVGYAFMNFGDAIDIIDLVHAREGKTWPDCISEKRAEVSYATLQGKEALVNKFRNSNVMTRPHEERPRLFHIDGPRAGSEAAFPGPNDASKLRRSVASTTQQGLFAPRNRAPTTPRTNRTRPQSQSFSQTPRGRQSVRTPRHSGGRSVQHAPGEFASMQEEDRQFISRRN
ncbi:RNA recognition motif 2 [Penicillium mononematosum]|uniref:RNA recognition motif 2 n=1 Tax=Penicillium mononematosum TaxID=268346 RepID=UPI002548F274|nr:RNA recognition motif 2 [Penicillium mononematosum]KAJ6186348.1 RNA recognition motif 2 [Penicillium mononematosum]